MILLYYIDFEASVTLHIQIIKEKYNQLINYDVLLATLQHIK